MNRYVKGLAMLGIRFSRRVSSKATMKSCSATTRPSERSVSLSAPELPQPHQSCVALLVGILSMLEWNIE